MALRLESEITRKYRKTKRKYDSQDVAPQMIKALTKIEGARYPNHTDLDDPNRDQQLKQDTSSRFSDASTLVSLNQTSIFNSGKIFDGPHYDPNKPKFATTKQFGLIKGILYKEPEEPEPLSDLKLWVDESPFIKQPEEKPKKSVKFNNEAQLVTYEQQDYFTEDQSIFRDRTEMLGAFTYAQEHAGQNKKQIFVPEVSAKEEAKMEIDRQKFEWSANPLKINQMEVFQPIKKEVSQTLFTNQVNQTGQNSQERNEKPSLTFSIYNKDVKYFLTGNQEKNLINSVQYLHGYRQGNVGGHGDQLLGGQQHRDEENKVKDSEKKQLEREAHMKYFLGVDNSSTQQLASLKKGGDHDDRNSNAGSEKSIAQARFGNMVMTEPSNKTESELALQTSESREQSRKQAFSKTEDPKDRYKHDLIASVNHFRAPYQTELQNMHTTMLALEIKSLADDKQDVLTQDEAVQAESQLIQLKDSLDIEIDKGIDVLRKQYHSGKFEESLQHKLIDLVEKGTVQGITDHYWQTIKTSLDGTQKGYQPLYENRVKKPKQYSSQEKEPFTNFTQNLQNPLDVIHQESNTQQLMAYDQNKRMAEIRQMYLDSKPLPLPQFSANLEYFVDGAKQSYALKKGGKEMEELLHDLEYRTPGNIHISLENRLKEFDPPMRQKANLDIQFLRSIYHYDMDKELTQPLDHLYKSSNQIQIVEKIQKEAQTTVQLTGDLGNKNLGEKFQTAAHRILHM